MSEPILAKIDQNLEKLHDRFTSLEKVVIRQDEQLSQTKYKTAELERRLDHKTTSLDTRVTILETDRTMWRGVLKALGIGVIITTLLAGLTKLGFIDLPTATKKERRNVRAIED